MKLSLQDIDTRIAEKKWPHRFTLNDDTIDDNYNQCSMLREDTPSVGFLDANAMWEIMKRDG